VTRTKRRPKLPELDRLPQIFKISEVEELAKTAFKIGKLPDIDILQAGIIEAARSYVLAVAAPSRMEIKQEIEDILKLAISGKYPTLASAIKQLSQQTHEFIEARGRGALPCHLSLIKPEHHNQVRRRVTLLCTSGVDGDGKYIPFVPPTQPNAQKRLAERDFIFALRYVIFDATGHVPGRTAARANTGPLASLALSCFELLEVKSISVALILEREYLRNWRWKKCTQREENPSAKLT
jgi:hypothetical protein